MGGGTQPWTTVIAGLAVAFLTVHALGKEGKERTLANGRPGGTSAFAAIPVNVGRQKQLLIDDTVIERMEGVRRVLNQPKKYSRNPVVRPDQPWEGRSLDLYGSVIHDRQANLFKMWYWARPSPSEAPLGCYAVSKDGIHWGKPRLNLTVWRSGRRNNIISQLGMGMIHSPDDPDPSRRYKALAGRRGTFSPDGIRWSIPEQSEEIAGDLASDNVIPFAYDETTRQFMAFGKVVRDAAGFPRRAVSTSFSKNFLTWTPADAEGRAATALTPDARDDELARERVAKYRDRCRFVDGPEWNLAQFYGHCGFPYAGMYLGLLWVFDISGWKAGMPKRPAAGGEDGPVMVELTSSRDAREWNRAGNRQVFLPLGKARSWEAGSLYTVNRPIIVGDEIWIYYSGFQTTHGHPIWWDRDLAHPTTVLRQRYPELDFDTPLSAIGLAKLRLDGWISVDAGAKTGTLTTKPLRFEGTRLIVNADARQGSIVVEILDGNGQPIPGFGQKNCRPLRSDSVRQEVRWTAKTRLSSIRGKPIRLRFGLTKTKLYSFAFSS